MRIFGLLGYPLDHSWSPVYFSRKFALENNNEDIYRLFPLPSLDSFHDLVSQTGHLCGLNITLPYKISIIPYLNDVDETAAKIGSVNTVLVSQGNTNRLTKGFNTDILGFEKSLKPHLSPLHKKALIFGTGGASKSVAFVLGTLGIEYEYVSRHPLNEDILSYGSLNNINLDQYLLLVNATPVGQYPGSGNPLHQTLITRITSKHLLFDLVYNPAETEFIRAGKSMGADCVNGMDMLIYQAEESWKIWNHVEL
jgi:shikimate dehydrogenase